MEAHVLDGLGQLQMHAKFFATESSFAANHRTLGRIAHRIAGLTLREPERLMENRLLRTATDFEPHLVLVILGSQVSPKTIEKLRQQIRCPIVAWCQDALTSFGRQYLLGAHYDHVFLKDRYLVDLFQRMLNSSEFHYLPEACNPSVHRTAVLSAAEEEIYGCDVMIAGSLYYYRLELLDRLRDFDLHVWGTAESWLVNRVAASHQGRTVTGPEKAKAVRGARISLNTLHLAEIDGLNCRAFELAGCGAFQLITAKPVLSEHFVPGSELETFSSADEMVDKIRHYLNKPAVASEIAAAGQRRAYMEHTYRHRLADLMNIVGMNT